MSAQRKIVILGTGGTIAGVGSAQGAGVGYQAGQIAVEQLVVPVLQQDGIQDVAYEAEQVAQLDSKDMDIASWQKLCLACQKWLLQEEVLGIVITHGTDTLEESAWFLQCALQPTKPVVMTCAMRPSTALSADGPANLRDAVQVVAQINAGGVYVVAAGEMHSAQWVHKAHPYRVHAFDSGSHGPLAWIEEGSLRWSNRQSNHPTLLTCDRELLHSVVHTPADKWPWVEVMGSCAAARAAGVEAMLDAGVDGLILATTGNGSIHRALLPALQRARMRGIPVVQTTRCEQGSIVLAAGAQDPSVSELSPFKARISLMLELLQKRSAAPCD